MGFMSTKLAYGFLAVLPARRAIPNAFPAVVLQDETVVCPDGERMSQQDFADLVERGGATRIEPQPFQDDHCVFVPAGDSAPLYTSLNTAASWFKQFAQYKTAMGDLVFADGDKETALHHYAHAAAAAQHPDYYRKMLQCPMSATRRTRIEALLSSLESEKVRQ